MKLLPASPGAVSALALWLIVCSAARPTAAAGSDEGFWIGVAGHPHELFVSTDEIISPIAGSRAIRFAVVPDSSAGAIVRPEDPQASLSLLEGHLPIATVTRAIGAARAKTTIVPDLFADTLWAFVRITVQQPEGAPQLRVAAELPGESDPTLAPTADGNLVRIGDDILLTAERPPADGDGLSWTLQPDDSGAVAAYFAVPIEPVERAEDSSLPEPGAEDFADRLQRVSDWWRATLHRVELKLPDEGLADAWYWSIAQMLIAKDGAELRQRPGEDGEFALGPAAFQCAALDTAGLHEVAADCVRLILRSQMRSGQFPRAFHDIRAIRPDRRWRSQGQAAFAIATHYRLTQDDAWLRAVYPALRRACDFLIRTREPQFADALLGKPEYGLLPPSPAAAGQPGRCFYADSYWSIYALRTAGELAEELKHTQDAERFGKAATGLERWLGRSIEQVKQNNGLPWTPEATDAGDRDAAAPATARGVWPTGVLRASNGFVATSFMVYSQGQLGNRDDLRPAGSIALALGHAALELGRPDLARRATAFRQGGPEPSPRDAPGTCQRAAEYVLLLRDMLAAERDDGLGILRGARLDWWTNEGQVGVQAMPTAFGPVNVQLDARPSRHRVILTLAAPKRDSVPRYIVSTPEGMRITKVRAKKRPLQGAVVRDDLVELPGSVRRVDLAVEAVSR